MNIAEIVFRRSGVRLSCCEQTFSRYFKFKLTGVSCGWVFSLHFLPSVNSVSRQMNSRNYCHSTAMYELFFVVFRVSHSLHSETGWWYGCLCCETSMQVCQGTCFEEWTPGENIYHGYLSFPIYCSILAKHSIEPASCIFAFRPHEKHSVYCSTEAPEQKRWMKRFLHPYSWELNLVYFVDQINLVFCSVAF